MGEHKHSIAGSLQSGIDLLVTPGVNLPTLIDAIVAVALGSADACCHRNGWHFEAVHVGGADMQVIDGDAIREVEPELSTNYRRVVRLGPIGHVANPFRLTQAYAALFEKMGGRIRRATVRRLVPRGAATDVEYTDATVTADKVVVAAGTARAASCHLFADRRTRVSPDVC